MKEGFGLDALIEALQIFRKYGNPTWPTHCEHDTMQVLIDPEVVSIKDMARLEKLGFVDSEEDTFVSHRFGSA